MSDHTAPLLGWHFLPENKRLQCGDHRVVRAGCTYRYKGDAPINLCRAGMHASVDIMDALNYAPGPILCRVEVSGDVIKGDDKIVGRARKVLWMFDATRVLHEWACLCAEDALSLTDSPDPRSLEAIRVKRLWMDGKATDDELSAAMDAAWDSRDASAAASAAARDSACAAARTASGDADRDDQRTRLLSMIEEARHA